MKALKNLLLICLCFVAAATAQEVNTTGAGSRAQGMGGAFIGVADDATAIYWNPAGLSQLTRPGAALSSRIVHENGNIFAVFDQNDNIKRSVDQSHGLLNFGSIEYPLQIGSTTLVAALAYQRPIDFYSNIVIGTKSVDDKGGVDTYTAGCGIKWGSVVSIGAAVNYWTGNYNGKMVDGQELIMLQDFSFNGFNIHAGAIADFAGLTQPIPVKLGICVRTPFELKGDGTLIDQYPESHNQNQFQVRKNIQIPLMLGIGASVTPFMNMTVAADFELRAYADAEIEWEMNGRSSSDIYSEKNRNQFRLGAEYVIAAGDFQVPIRAGYTKLPTEYQDGYSQASGKAYSFGAGFKYSKFALDAAFTTGTYSVVDHPLNADLDMTGKTVTTSLVIFL